jgi:hypothetical protein
VESFLREAPKAWKALKDEYQKGVNLTITHSVDMGPLSTTIEICFDKNNELNRWIYGKPSTESIMIVNSRYAFNLKKKGESANWALTEIMDDTNAARSTPNSGFSKLLPATINLFDGIMLHDGWLEALVASDSFSITSIREVENDRLVELVFSSQFKPFDNYQILRGTVHFDPKQFWLVKKYEIDVDELQSSGKKHTYKFTVTIDYQNVDGIPFPQKNHCVEVRDGKDEHTLTKNYTSVSRKKCPREIFYLSHYGFSEPDYLQLNKTRFVLIVVGLLMIIVGLLMKFLLKNSKE